MCTTVNINEWIQQNKASFLPPVCNKLMHEKQLKVFFVGGPNQRKDFHLEEGEELFYMKQGSMELVTLQEGRFKTIVINEGEVFLLPGKIPHSPQRKEETIGLVIERERATHELDCLRYYVDGTSESLFERWFYCDDLGVQLVPVIKEYFASEQHRTGRPIPGTIPANPPYQPDSARKTEEPFNLKTWLQVHREEIHRNGVIKLFGESYQSKIHVYGKGMNELGPMDHEVWIWQLEGESEVELNGKSLVLKQDYSLLIPIGTAFTLKSETENDLLLSVAMSTPS